MSEKIIIKSNGAVEEFKTLLQDGFSKIIDACKLYVSILDQSEKLADEFRRFIPEIPSSAWKRYERVGRGTLHPKLFAWRMCPGVERLEKLPYEEQEKYTKEKFRLLVSGGDELLVSVQDLTNSQSKQVIVGNHVRSLAEQKAYLEDLKSKKLEMIEIKNLKSKVYSKPWNIVNKKKININGVLFERKDLVSMLSEMER